MGNLTAKISGEIASFMTPAKTNIKSLKVHFSPKQLGTGDPSPENVREIEGWDGVEACQTSINLLDQSYITSASGWALSSDDGNTTFCGVPVYKGIIAKFYQKFKSGYPFVGNPFKENVQYNVSVWLKTVSGNSLQGLKFGFKYTDGTTSLGGIFAADDTWKRQTVTSKANKTVSGIYCSYNNSGKIYLCGLAVCEKELDDTSVVYPSAINNISIDWSNNIETIYGGYIDLISGELVEEYNFVNIDYSNPWGTTTNYLYRYDNLPPSIGGRNTYVKTLCSHRINPFDVTAAVVVGTQGNMSVGRKFCEMAGIEMTSDAFNQYLEEQNNNGTPLEICYLLATPITHQLTPTQLSSFIGQNNFWSNADYVEIEYELKETEDIQKARKKIILNQPYIESITGDAVSFTTDMEAPLKECKVYFEPVQEGEGDPSPENVRNITGWDGVEVKNGDNVYSIDWINDVGTVYGGYVDLISGELVAEWIERMINSFNWSYNSSGECFRASSTDIKRKNVNEISPIQSKIYKTTKVYNSISYWLNVDDFSISEHIGINSQDELINSIHIKDSRYTTVSDFLNGVGNESIIYKLETPIHYQLTPQQLLTLKGINNFSCGIKNDLSVRYWNYKKSNSNNIAYEAKNLTFDGTNYIDTGVYLFSEKNINRDFEVVIEDLYGGDPSNKTIVCAKYDSTAIGFLIRLNSAVGTIYNGTISMKTNNHNNITIKRINSIITIEGEIITNPNVKITNAVHQHPLVLGCALQDDGIPFRYQAGTIGHITVKWL